MIDCIIVCTCLTKLVMDGIIYGKNHRQCYTCPECGTMYNTNIKIQVTNIGPKKKRGEKK